MGILFSFYVLAFSLYLKKNEQMNANGDRFLNSFKRFIMTNMTVTEKQKSLLIIQNLLNGFLLLSQSDAKAFLIYFAICLRQLYFKGSTNSCKGLL